MRKCLISSHAEKEEEREGRGGGRATNQSLLFCIYFKTISKAIIKSDLANIVFVSILLSHKLYYVILVSSKSTQLVCPIPYVLCSFY